MKDMFVEFGKKPNIFSCKEFLSSCLMTEQAYVYRGQGSSSWQLIPSLFRGSDGLLIDQSQRIDRIAYFSKQEFAEHFQRLKRSTPESEGLKLRDGPYAKLQQMVFFQHFGVETPLLDWSESPLVALFMAFVFRPQGSKKMRIYRLNSFNNPSTELIYQSYEMFDFDRIRRQVGGITFFGHIDDQTESININPTTFEDYLKRKPDPNLLECIDVKILKDEEKLVSDVLKTNGFTYDGMFPNSPYWLSRAIKSGLPWN